MSTNTPIIIRERHSWQAHIERDGHPICASWRSLEAAKRWIAAQVHDTYRWIAPEGHVVSFHPTLEEASRQYRHLCRTDIHCLDPNGDEVTDAAITSAMAQ